MISPEFISAIQKLFENSKVHSSTMPNAPGLYESQVSSKSDIDEFVINLVEMRKRLVAKEDELLTLEAFDEFFAEIDITKLPIMTESKFSAIARENTLRLLTGANFQITDMEG